MKDIISELNKAFESRIRLGIMSILMVNDCADFNTLKEMLNVSDGNLASHITALEKLAYITVTKKFIGKKTNTTYCASETGRAAFKDHLDALERLIKGGTND
jgi:predicted transcriptional regulator